MVNRPDSKKARQKRHTRVRAKISGTAECPRLNVFRSLQHIYELERSRTGGAMVRKYPQSDRYASHDD